MSSESIKQPARIYLTGLRGTGKTTTGKLISERLGSRCVDLDVLIEETAGKTIKEIFQDSGEETFRDLESECLQTVAKQPVTSADYYHVVALGGGAILREENRQLIHESGDCIWLKADPQTLAMRMSQDETTGQRRPALTDLSPQQEIEAMLEKRKHLYEDAADFHVDTEGKSIEQVATEVLAILGC